MEDIIKKVLLEYRREKRVISEMAKLDWCKDFPKYKPEYQFCTAAEEYIKTELEDSPSEGRRKRGKKIFADFEKGMIDFYTNNESDEIITKKILKIDETHPIFLEGLKEMNEANRLLKSNCPNFMKVAEKKLKDFKEKIKLYFIENELYSLDNRLPTNYSAIAVLFTMFFSKKGAFDEVVLEDQDWDKIAKNWISHSFDGSIPFDDIRPEEEKKNKLTSLDFQELARIYFKNDTVYNSNEIRKSVKKVLEGVRGKGFESEDSFENMYLKDKKNYIRYAKDYGFVDMFGGVDFVYEGKNGMYIPVQVKTTATEPTYLISQLGCKAYLVVEKKGSKFYVDQYPKKENLPY